MLAFHHYFIDSLLIGDSIVDGIVAHGLKTIAESGYKEENLTKVIADEEPTQFRYFMFGEGNNLQARSRVLSDIEEPVVVFEKLLLLLSKVRELPIFRVLAVMKLLPRFELGSPKASISGL